MALIWICKPTSTNRMFHILGEVGQLSRKKQPIKTHSSNFLSTKNTHKELVAFISKTRTQTEGTSGFLLSHVWT